MTCNDIELKKLTDTLKEEIENHLLPFWMNNAVDNERGGFYGRILNDNTVIENAPRSVILYTRILWTFSAAYRVLPKDEYLSVAGKAYDYIINHFWDDLHGGVYWLVDHTGKPLEDKKHTYAQAFAIYGLSEYHRVTANTIALNKAIDVYTLLKKHGIQDSGAGCHEAFSRQWDRLRDVRLSEKDDEQQRSMNTHLHLFEAFANLYRIWPDKDLKIDLMSILQLFFGPIYNNKTGHFYTFFDEKWNPASDLYSYGHDIEAAWLLMDASRVLENNELIDKSRRIALATAEATLREGIDPVLGGIYQSGRSGEVVDSDKHWWAQAEAIVGFVYAYRETENFNYLKAAESIWEFISTYMIDAESGEWFFRVNREGKPYQDEDKVGAWKCPYHNVRMGLELTEIVNAGKELPGEEITGIG